MEIKVKKSEPVKVTVGDKVYEVRRPKMREQIELDKKLKAVKQGEGSFLEVALEWTEGLGLPKEAGMEFEQEQFMELIGEISGTKKNA